MRHLSNPEKGDCIGPTKCGIGSKIELVVDATAIPIGIATDSASISETMLGPAALAAISSRISIPRGTPVITDRAYVSDKLRDQVKALGFRLLLPHRKNRKAAKTNDGRRMRRYRRRWLVERTFAWLHSYRRAVTRFERSTALW